MDTASDLQHLIASKALSLPDVTPKRMFGSDTYLVRGKMFAAFGPMGLMLKPPTERAEEMLKLCGCSRMEMRPGTPFGGWIAIDPSTSLRAGPAAAWDEAALLSALEESYNHVRSLPTARKRKRSARVPFDNAQGTRETIEVRFFAVPCYRLMANSMTVVSA